MRFSTAPKTASGSPVLEDTTDQQLIEIGKAGLKNPALFVEMRMGQTDTRLPWIFESLGTLEMGAK